MKQFTRTGADALKDILRRDGFEMKTIEYPHLFMLEFFDSPMAAIRNKIPTRVLINVRGKHHASWWMKGYREEFGIPAVEFATYVDTAKNLGVPLYFVFYEGVSKTISFISSNDVLMYARVWEKDNVDEGGTLFVPKRKVIPLAHLEEGQTRYINHFIPEKFTVQTVIE